ncbi:MAG: PAS domain S-box protein [Mariniphaga sp.]
MDTASQPIRILFAEDLPTDVEMAKREIRKGGIEFISKVVDTETEFRKELEEFKPDIVISDYSMPTFDGMSALKITREHSRHKPFVVLTGSMNEETAVACMKAGANDYVIKEQIKRLPYAIKEAIEKAVAREEKQKIEQQLRQSLGEYRDLINGMSETVWIIDTEGNLIEVNETAVKVLGYTREELVELGLHGIDNHLPKKQIADLANQMPTVKNQFFQTWHTTKSGKKIPVEINSTLVNYNGKKAIMSIARDITERIEIENQLKLLSRSVEQSPVSIVVTDNNGIIEYVNSAFTKVTGYSSDEVKGMKTSLFKSGNHSQKFYKQLWNTILRGEEWHGELMNRKKNGELFWEDISISPVYNLKQEITHFISIREDVTEKKKMIDDLIAAKEKAEESDRLKSAFLANMSHEIRTPMNGILGFTELLKEPKLTGEEKNEYIKIIQKSGQRMLNTINDLIEISKIESGSLELKLKEVNVNEQLDYIYNFFKPETENKGLAFKLHKALPVEQVIVETDQEKLNGVLMNLIKNAIKYTNQGGIEMGYRVVENTLEFFVKDTGIGIEKKHREFVFERFAQADISLSKPYEGAGLGLSIAKAYVEILGGKIWFESESSKGSQFYFTIPFTKKPAEKKITSYEQPCTDGEQALKNLTILVAEDDTTSQIYISELLRGKCKKVFFAENGKEAVQLFSENPEIDLVLMDMKMPLMDGYQATAKIKEINRDTVVIAQTAYALSGDKEKILEAGCDDYLPKPFPKKRLIELVWKYFG